MAGVGLNVMGKSGVRPGVVGLKVMMGKSVGGKVSVGKCKVSVGGKV